MLSVSIITAAETDIVCVIGVVKVKCVGNVRAGERLYATVDMEQAGVATPESYLPPSVLLSRTSTLLGMSLEDRKSKKLDETNLVRSFVCIVMGINNKQINMEIEGMYAHFEKDVIIKLKKERKRVKRCTLTIYARYLQIMAMN